MSLRDIDAMFSSSPQQNTTDPENLTNVYEAVRWVQLSMAILSIISSGSMVVFAASRKLFQSQEVHPLLLLSGSDLLLAVSWLVGAALFTSDLETHVTCYHLHIVEQILYMMSFFYTLYCVWTLYCGLRSRLNCSVNGFMAEEASRQVFPRIMAAVAGLLPALLMCPVLIQGNLAHCYANRSQPYRCLLMQTGPLYHHPAAGSERWDCWVLHAYRDFIFLFAFLVTLTGIMVLMKKARNVHRRVVASGGFLGDRQWATLRKLERRMLLYPSIFIFCWAPALCVAILRLMLPMMVQGLVAAVFYIVQAFTSGSHGCLNSLAYGWSSLHLCGVQRRAVLRDADTQTPLLRSQRQGYGTLRHETTAAHSTPGSPCSHT